MVAVPICSPPAVSESSFSLAVFLRQLSRHHVPHGGGGDDGGGLLSLMNRFFIFFEGETMK